MAQAETNPKTKSINTGFKGEQIRMTSKNTTKESMTIIDLFSGCGGLSQGFKDAGFEIVFANDVDENCAMTYRYNHCNHGAKTPFYQGDIRQLDNEALLKLVKRKTVDGVIGGPPCQGFSLAGKRRPNDPRNHLVYEFMRVVELFKPKFFLMENVPGLLSMDEGKTYEKIIAEFGRIGYRINTENNILDSSYFGVPQTRKRLFILGFREDFNKQPTLPSMVSTKKISVWEAISDLPQIKAGEGEETQKYIKKAITPYEKWARVKSREVHNHVAMKHTGRILNRFSATKSGEGVEDVMHLHPIMRREGRKSHKVFSQNHNRLFPDKPSPTVAAGFKINFIHPYLDRSLTAREGARLQSFRDTFIFFGKRTRMSWEKGLEQYEQIGNAVPPLLAEAVAKHIKKSLF